MRRLPILIAIAAMGAMPTSAYAATVNTVVIQPNKSGNVIVGQMHAGDIKEVKDKLSSMGINTSAINFEDCLDGDITDIVWPNPDKPEIDKPEIGKPEIDRPEIDKPETPDDSQMDSSYAQQVVKLVNQERARAGLSSLKLDRTVEKAAQVRAKEIVTSFAHTRPNGSSFSSALTENGVSFRGSGENIAWGQKTPDQVMREWMNSPGHRANILNESFTTIGIGHYKNSEGTDYWTQLFTY